MGWSLIFAAGLVRRRKLIAVGFLSQGDDCDHATGPRGQFADDGHKFDNESWQQQDVKTQCPSGENHRPDIDGAIDKKPAKRANDELNAVGDEGHGECEDDSE